MKSTWARLYLVLMQNCLDYFKPLSGIRNQVSGIKYQE